jgi:hypothetical protein
VHASGIRLRAAVSQGEHSATGFYHTESRYKELVQAIGDGRDEPSGPLSQLAGIEVCKPVASGTSPQLSAWGR